MNDEDNKNYEYLDNDILSKAFISEYNLEMCTQIALKIMHHFVRLKNKYPNEPTIRITSRYEPIYSCSLPRENHQMDSIDKKIDEVAEYRFMNEKITAMMKIMNADEKKCFTEKFINEKTEYQLSKVMQRSRCGVIPFVNSCIGCEIKDVAEVLGHKRIETTQKYYILSLEENKKKVTKVFEDEINKI